MVSTTTTPNEHAAETETTIPEVVKGDRLDVPAFIAAVEARGYSFRTGHFELAQSKEGCAVGMLDMLTGDKESADFRGHEYVASRFGLSSEYVHALESGFEHGHQGDDDMPESAKHGLEDGVAIRQHMMDRS